MLSTKSSSDEIVYVPLIKDNDYDNRNCDNMDMNDTLYSQEDYCNYNKSNCANGLLYPQKDYDDLEMNINPKIYCNSQKDKQNFKMKNFVSDNSIIKIKPISTGSKRLINSSNNNVGNTNNSNNNLNNNSNNNINNNSNNNITNDNNSNNVANDNNSNNVANDNNFNNVANDNIANINNSGDNIANNNNNCKTFDIFVISNYYLFIISLLAFSIYISATQIKGTIEFSNNILEIANIYIIIPICITILILFCINICALMLIGIVKIVRISKKHRPLKIFICLLIYIIGYCTIIVFSIAQKYIYEDNKNNDDILLYYMILYPILYLSLFTTLHVLLIYTYSS